MPRKKVQEKPRKVVGSRRKLQWRPSMGEAAWITLMAMSSPTPPSTPSKRDGAATRQKLLRAALELFTTVGFRATTTPEIAARADVAEGTIYRHFTSKE